jgi:hypothetical protein
MRQQIAMGLRVAVQDLRNCEGAMEALRRLTSRRLAGMIQELALLRRQRLNVNSLYDRPSPMARRELTFYPRLSHQLLDQEFKATLGLIDPNSVSTSYVPQWVVYRLRLWAPLVPEDALRKAESTRGQQSELPQGWLETNLKEQENARRDVPGADLLQWAVMMKKWHHYSRAIEVRMPAKKKQDAP